MSEELNPHDYGLEGFELKTQPSIPPAFINKPGSSFLATVLLRDDRDPSHVLYFQLMAVEPVECLNGAHQIVAVGPGEIFSCEGHNLNHYLGLTISLEVTDGDPKITVDKHDTPTEPPPSTERE